jgi:hypothetical protein
MNKLFLLITLFFLQLNSQSQNDLQQKIKQLIQEKHPELDLSNKLIGCVIWSIKDEESRNQNKSFEKTVNVFEHAKLKGGSKGIVILSVNRENLNSEATLVLENDHILKLIPLKLEELNGLNKSSVQNIVFNSDGIEVYRDLPSSQIFSSINKLITR